MVEATFDRSGVAGADAKEATAPAQQAKSTRRRRRGPGRMATLLVLAMIALGVGLRAVNPDWIETLRVRTFDIYQQVLPRPVGQYPVAIIDLDEKSLAEVGQWPWPRTTVAQLIEKLGAAGVAVVGFDIVYAEPDRMSPALFAQSLPNADPAMVESLRQLPSNETVMADAMKRTPVVVGQAAIRSPLPAGKDATKAQSSVKGQLGGDPIPSLDRFAAILPNVPELEAAAAGHGNFAIGDEVDGLIRRVPLIVAVGEKDVRPALSLEMLRVAFRGRTVVTKRNEAGMESVILQTPGGTF
ncbi:MAG: CHASE2 domain-containing protein, partial [Alphaproteobacteria bacterium]